MELDGWMKTSKGNWEVEGTNSTEVDESERKRETDCEAGGLCKELPDLGSKGATKANRHFGWPATLPFFTALDQEVGGRCPSQSISADAEPGFAQPFRTPQPRMQEPSMLPQSSRVFALEALRTHQGH